MNLGKTNSIIILLSATSFSSIILYLQKIQTNYNPTHQLMSELALGRQGQLMLVAFTMLAIAVAGAAGIVIIFKASKLIVILLGSVSASLIGAGIFKLGTATILHVVLVGLAFVLLGIAMYLIPRYVTAFNNIQSRLISWGLAVSMALAIALSNNILPIGIGQRLAVACILFWLCWLAIFTLKHNIVHIN